MVEGSTNHLLTISLILESNIDSLVHIPPTKNAYQKKNTSHQNGTVERKHRQIFETGLTLVAHASLPYEFWDHSFTTAVYLINRLPTSALPNSTSLFYALHKETPDYHNFKVFGCACFPHLRPYNKHKILFRSAECIYLGPSPQHKGYKCLASDGKIYISKDVLFNEIRFPYPNLFPPPNLVTDNTVKTTYPTSIPVGSNFNEAVSCPNSDSGLVSTVPEVSAPSASPSNCVPQPQPATTNTHPM